MNFQEAEDIPGMIELVERKMLYVSVQSLSLEDGDNIIEFGPFFGRSTNCIAQGLKNNKTFSHNCRFLTYDSFHCNVNGWFAPHVLRAAESGGVTDMLETKNDRINFEPIFNYYMKNYIDSGIVSGVKSELTNSNPPDGPICFMHIDSPKFFEEFKTILSKFLPKSKLGSLIVFQDFFYQWSASLILPIAILLKKDFLSIQESAASSLLCKVIKVPNQNDILEIVEDMNNEKKCIEIFDYVIGACKKIKLDRPESFLPKITLAKIQWLYSNGKYNDARKTIVSYIREGNPFQLKLVDTFLELLGYGFSIRHLFELDHSNDFNETLSGSGSFEVDKRNSTK